MMDSMRSWALVVLLAGCNVVFPLEPPTHDASADVLTGHDEDGDGIADEIDPCPHLASGDHDDSDGDGIGNACDPYPTVGGDEWHFYSFVDGIGDLVLSGSIVQVEDAVELGDVSQQVQFLYLPIPDADDVEIELGYQILAPMEDGAYHEVGVFAVAQENDPATQGDVCFGGYDGSPYQELQEFPTNVDIKHPLTATTFDVPSTLHMRRTPRNMNCSLIVPNAQANGELMPQLTKPGRTGVSVGFARARLRYLWVVVHR